MFPLLLLLLALVADDNTAILSAGGDLEADEDSLSELMVMALARSLYDILFISGDALMAVVSAHHADGTVMAVFTTELDFTDVEDGCCHCLLYTSDAADE